MCTVFAPHGSAILKRNVAERAVADAFFAGDTFAGGMKLPGVHEQFVIESTYYVCQDKFSNEGF